MKRAGHGNMAVSLCEEIMEKKEKYILALGVALLPPVWAVLGGIIGIECSGIALVCAGIYVAAGNQACRANGIMLGFTGGVIWGNLADWQIKLLGKYFNENAALFLVLFIMGGSAVLFANVIFREKPYLPAWLCGFALTLGSLGRMSEGWLIESIKILISMAAGVYYVGIGVSVFERRLRRIKR